MPIRGQVNAGGGTRCQILHEARGGTGVADAKMPARSELRIRINRRPDPAVAAPAPLFIARHVALPAVHEGPGLAALNALTGQVHQRLALELFANRTTVRNRHQDGRLRHSGLPRSDVDRRASTESCEGLSAGISIETIHVS